VLFNTLEKLPLTPELENREQDEKEMTAIMQTNNTLIKACKVTLFGQICMDLISRPKKPS
jgi:hypothetical protein